MDPGGGGLEEGPGCCAQMLLAAPHPFQHPGAAPATGICHLSVLEARPLTLEARRRPSRRLFPSVRKTLPLLLHQPDSCPRLLGARLPPRRFPPLHPVSGVAPHPGCFTDAVRPQWQVRF